MPDTAAADTAPTARSRITPLDIVRVGVLIAALASLVVWGFAEFSLPLSLVVGVGAPALMLILWALFLSPRPVLRVHAFIAAIVELAIYAAVTMAWWAMGQAWIGIAFALVAVAAGLVAGRRRLA